MHTGYYNENDQIRNKLKQATIKFLKSLEPGICASIILNSTLRKQYLSDNLIGRVQPVGTFLSSSSALAYIYGLLCDIPNSPKRSDSVQTVDLLQLTYDPDYYRISAKIQINLASSNKLIFFGMVAFDKDLKLCGYEAVVQNGGLTTDIPSNQHSLAIQGLCQAIQIACPVGSPLQQYENVTECISFLSEPTTPFGTYDRADQNNAVCRLIHSNFVHIEPTVHCPHLGKTGGDACTDKTAKSYFEGKTDFLQCAYKAAN